MNKKLRILCVYRHYFTERRGTSLRIKSLLSELSNNKDFVIHTASQDQTTSFSAGHIQITGNIFNDVDKLRRYINEREIDLVVFHTLSAAYYLIPIKVFTRVKVVLEMHGFLEEEGWLYGDLSLFKYYRNKLFYALIYFLADFITTCSDTATEILKKYNRNVATIFGGVDPDLFNPKIKPGSFLSSDEKKKIVIGYAGNTRKWQGLDFLKMAFERLKENDSSFLLVLLLSEDATQVETGSLKVFRAVPHEDVASFNACCDILVIPRNDSKVNRIAFPSKLLEYMAMGKVVISSRTSDVDKIIVNGENGLLFEPGDTDGFLECLERAKDSRLRNYLGENAAKTALEQYSWKIQSQKLSKYLLNTLND